MSGSKIANRLLAVGLCGYVGVVGLAVAGQDAPMKGGVSTAPTGMVQYVPPKRGLPGGRLGGGTRGDGADVVVSVLAPDHTGFTGQPQPILYWYLSDSSPRDVRFTLVDADAVKTIVETSVGPTAQAGVQRVRLADLGVRLQEGVRYQWFVGVVVDPKERTKDIVAGGVVERSPLPGDLSSKLAGAGKAESASLYAEAGFWYDALDMLSAQIQDAPRDQKLRRQRASLMEQVGLSEVADFDLHAKVDQS